MEPFLLHIFLEITAACAAFFTGCLAYRVWHSSIQINKTDLVAYRYLAIFSVVAIGGVDVLHALGAASPSIIPDQYFFIPSTYLAGKVIASLLLLAMLFKLTQSMRWAWISVIAVVASFSVGVSEYSGYYSDATVIGRWPDLIPVILLLPFILYLLPRRYKNSIPGFDCCVFQSMIIMVIAQTIMAFSHDLFDWPFTIAHIIQILVPLPFARYIIAHDR